MAATYVVNEHFAAFQGEGVFAGCPAYFVRLHGCDQSCHFCDSAGTWHPKFKAPHPRFSAEALAELVEYNAGQAFAPGLAFVVLTGGEPTLYELPPLVDALHEVGFAVHLETAGHHVIPDGIDWITLSPKPFATPPRPENVVRADEFKLIVESAESLAAAVRSIDVPGRRGNAPVWLHPEWGKREDREVLRLIIEAVKRPPLHALFRAGWQTHKLYAVDQMDPNADRRRIPLGGDERNGY